MPFARRFLHYSPGPTDLVGEIECRAVGGAWFELNNHGGCGDGELSLLDTFTNQSAIDIGDWIAFEYDTGDRWYLGQVRERQLRIPSGVKLKLKGMGSQLEEVYPGGFASTKADGIPYEKASFPWAASGRSLSLGRDEGVTKLLFDPETRRVLGGGIVGPGAGELIAEVALAIEMGSEAADIALTIHPHPTLSETIAFAAEAFEGTLTDLYLPKRKR